MEESKRLKIAKIWMDFYILIRSISQTDSTVVDDESIDKFSVAARLWLSDFVHLYPSKSVTPYMHMFVKHTPELIKFHGNIWQYSPSSQAQGPQALALSPGSVC
jgi:hypothetical protein